mmetsp:Transcript_24434/g.72944  ORF Transcript_24434/g.72944 Transcript_24434/m.72944 type:complete len:94 (+) Transcript_24434:166-447(+)
MISMMNFDGPCCSQRPRPRSLRPWLVLLVWRATWLGQRTTVKFDAEGAEFEVLGRLLRNPTALGRIRPPWSPVPCTPHLSGLACATAHWRCAF